MFVISCKYYPTCNWILNLVPQIRKFHPTEEIVVVDSDSDDKSYFKAIEPFNVIIEDVKNKCFQIGAYWYAFKKYPDKSFYYFMHDSMIVKANLDSYKNRDLTLIATFDRSSTHADTLADKVKKYTPYTYSHKGCGCYGIQWWSQNHVMQKLLEAGCDNFTATTKWEAGCLEGMYGFFFEQLGYNLMDCALFGDILVQESPIGKSGMYPHKTSWQYPVEKFYAQQHTNIERLI